VDRPWRDLVRVAQPCRLFITANATQGSGIVGDGAIDGRGGSLLPSGPNAGQRSWWDVAFQNKTQGLSQQVPLLVKIVGGGNFTLYRVAVKNAPNFHIVTSGVNGITAWGLKLLTPSIVYSQAGYACPAGSTPDVKTPATCFTPDTAKSTDGFDPGNSRQVVLAHSFISVGDDDVAVKLHNGPTSTQLAFLHNHFYYGHGMLVEDLVIDGHDSSNSIVRERSTPASPASRFKGCTTWVAHATEVGSSPSPATT
jgi:polygalacturonase